MEKKIVVQESNQLNHRIKEIKFHFNLNNEGLAKLCEVTRQAIGDIENGVTTNPKVSLVANMSTKLGINLNWLLTGEGEMLLDSSNNVSERKMTSLTEKSSLEWANKIISLQEKEINRLWSILDKADLGKNEVCPEQPALGEQLGLIAA